MIKLQEQSYQSNFYFPRPELHFDAAAGFCIIAFPWGSRSSAKKVISHIVDFFHSTQNDQEVTSPFEKLSCLSPMANNIRVALMLTNDLIFKEDNSQELVSGLEVVVLAQNQNEFVIGQVGAPAIYLARDSKKLINISSHYDLSASVLPWKASSTVSPLPYNLLGTHSTSLVKVNEFKPQQNDKLILTSLNQVPEDVSLLSKQNFSFKFLVDHFVSKQPEQGFWLGQITF